MLTLDGRDCGGRLEALDDSGGSGVEWDSRCSSMNAQLKEYFVESFILLVFSGLKACFQAVLGSQEFFVESATIASLL